MKHSLKITPSIAPGIRHKIEDFLKILGYEVTDGGTRTDMSECDISFNDNLNLERGESGSSASK